MKFIAVAAIALLGQVSAVRYAESEGPTKVDLGDIDHLVVGREADDDYKDHGPLDKGKFHGWTNPLSWTDDGADDDVVLFQMK